MIQSNYYVEGVATKQSSELQWNAKALLKTFVEELGDLLKLCLSPEDLHNASLLRLISIRREAR